MSDDRNSNIDKLTEELGESDWDVEEVLIQAIFPHLDDATIQMLVDNIVLED